MTRAPQTCTFCPYPLTDTPARCGGCNAPLCPLHAHEAQMKLNLCPTCEEEYLRDLEAMDEARAVMVKEWNPR